ncbi:ankyrin repeat domain-containing protein [Pedobacter sp. ISL-68]|uniref:ankyrin repeat domain-containing protein n=1 Tax=unclassified Pedobacter TaxID=2628915 RepID=UPI001BE82FC4|nr:MULTISPECIES: ankyrin repeat domain-containing protein [unclassified Pedobacter]MBT2564884.1 ankyrin repeat domain-containing protein [Pedobacter sp. ISL-64]MBT2593441.1 ankyrin repeat domain-containing protein [Pedobacter sp. ISL-68]
MTEPTLDQQLNAHKFEEAKSMMHNGEKLSKSIQEHHKSSIFDHLVREKQYEILNMMLKDKTIETDIYEFDSFDKSIFQAIVRNLGNDDEDIAFFNEFITHFDNLNDEVNTKTLLSYFFENGVSLALIKACIDTGCTANFKNNAEENYIHQVVKSSFRRYNINDEQTTDLLKGYIELLLSEGVDINEGNVVQETPLITAIKFNKKNLIAHLLENGADPNHTDRDGNSAFFYAVVHSQSENIYDTLRNFASPAFDQVNKNGETLLFEYVRMMSNSESGINFLKKLIEDGADLYQASMWYGTDTTPLDIIAEKQADILQAVLETGQVDVNRADNKGNTLLHKVCAYNVNYEAEKAKETYRKVKLLIENGADIALTNDQDQTALMLASDDNLKIKTVELLMKQS